MSQSGSQSDLACTVYIYPLCLYDSVFFYFIGEKKELVIDACVCVGV